MEDSGTSMASAQPRILVVEDERIVALDLAATLKELGYCVVGLSSRGDEAILRTAELDPQLILMDVRLGGAIDGIQAAEIIRRTHDIPVIYLTAHSDNETLRRAARTNASGYLVKPFKSPELRCSIEIALHKHAAEARVKELNEALEHRVSERTSELEAANHDLESFSYSVAHDLRAPLRAIDSFSQLLVEEHAAHLNAEGLGYLNRVRAAAVRMGKLIDALLTLAGTGRSEMRCMRFNLTALIRDLSTEIASTYPRHRVQLHIGESSEMVYGDPGLLKVAMTNLLDNAWKFTQRTANASVEFGTVIVDSTRTFFVRDNGAGFDPAYADKLFGAFQRLHSEREFSGTGIGLAIVERVVRRHGGRIWAESAPGKGATFYFTLPDPTH